MAARKGPAIELRHADGKMSALPLPVHATESLLSEVRDSVAYPAVSAAREMILAWRFFCLAPMIGRFMFARLAVILSTVRET